MRNDEVIAARDLAAGYAGHEIWQGARLSIGYGAFVGVLGPNGSGKTTLFRLLLGLVKPMRGAMSVFGQTPVRGDARIGYVPQRHAMDSEMKIDALELVRLGLIGSRWGIGSARQGQEEALSALRSVGAEKLAHRALGVLSGGELQRIFLAEALVGKPDLLLLDEPLANLDICHEVNAVRLVHEVVRSRGITALLAAHNINPLLPVLDLVIYIANGRIASGRPQEVLTSKSLTDLYGIPVEVVKSSGGRVAVIGTEEPVHHHE